MEIRMKFKFCRECGSPAVDYWSGIYSPETGKKIMESRCSKDPCHTQHDRQDQPLFARGDWKCRKCGKLGWYASGI